MINGAMLSINIDKYLLEALREDISNEDVSTASIMKEKTKGSVDLIAKEDGIICGLLVFERVFKLLDENTIFEITYKDGDSIKNGDTIGKLTGDIRVLLSAERVALNYLQRMSAIASLTNKYVRKLDGFKTKLLDTRKTTPNNRIFEKYAVSVGGGCNHRFNLSDGVMLKDNHIAAAGSIIKAVEMARKHAPFVRKIEVEVETIEMVKEAIEAQADIIMLDNMDNETMKRAVSIIGSKAQTEVSGNITIERLTEIAQLGVDFISSGAIIYSANVMDLSMKNLKKD